MNCLTVKIIEPTYLFAAQDWVLGIIDQEDSLGLAIISELALFLEELIGWQELLRTLGQQQNVTALNDVTMIKAFDEDSASAGRRDHATPDGNVGARMDDRGRHEVVEVVGHEAVSATVRSPFMARVRAGNAVGVEVDRGADRSCGKEERELRADLSTAGGH